MASRFPTTVNTLPPSSKPFTEGPIQRIEPDCPFELIRRRGRELAYRDRQSARDVRRRRTLSVSGGTIQATGKMAPFKRLHRFNGSPNSKKLCRPCGRVPGKAEIVEQVAGAEHEHAC
jgi:hypothetical protein